MLINFLNVAYIIDYRKVKKEMRADTLYWRARRDAYRHNVDLLRAAITKPFDENGTSNCCIQNYFEQVPTFTAGDMGTELVMREVVCPEFKSDKVYYCCKTDCPMHDNYKKYVVGLAGLADAEKKLSDHKALFWKIVDEEYAKRA